MFSFIKKILLFIFKATLIFVSGIALYLLTAICLSAIQIKKEKADNNNIVIYIKSNGVHTDIVVPAKNEYMDWTKEIKYANVKLADSSFRYLAFGWGDKGFYLQTPTWADLKFSVAFKAAFALSTTAVHATYYKILNEGKDCKRLLINKNQYQRLIAYIQQSLQKDSQQHYVHIPTNANYGDTDAFYEANGSYSLFQTCNTWANSALKASGQKACLWTPFDKGIFYQYEE